MRSIRKTIHSAVYLCIVLLLFSAQAFAADLQLMWKPVKSSLLAGYMLHIAMEPRSAADDYTNYSIQYDVGNETSVLIRDIGKYKVSKMYFALTAYDKFGKEGPYSEELAVTFSAASTTTSSIVTTTSVPDSGGGGGGTSENRATTTSSVAPPQSTTTSTIPECSDDVDCNDLQFCNGIERCVDGVCVEDSTGGPCASGQMCLESEEECRDFIILNASPVLDDTNISKPKMLSVQRRWLVLKCEEKSNFDAEKSSISFYGPGGDSKGVKINDRRLAVKAGRIIFIPITVDKDAASGTWVVFIATEVESTDLPFLEFIEGDFTVN